MGDLVKLARVYIWADAIAKVLLAMAPLAVAAAFALGNVHIEIGGMP
ncbi:hypothetical protein [Streptomyces sp. B29(2018)]|nr:hypothetical protein [Streptomyces sp. B29(2018)]